MTQLPPVSIIFKTSSIWNISITVGVYHANWSIGKQDIFVVYLAAYDTCFTNDFAYKNAKSYVWKTQMLFIQSS